MDSIFLCVTLRRNEIESATKETWTLNRCAFASNSHAGPQMHRGWEARCCTQAPRTGSRGSSTAFRWSSKQLTRVKWAWTSSSREPSETARSLHAAGPGRISSCMPVDSFCVGSVFVSLFSWKQKPCILYETVCHFPSFFPYLCRSSATAVN